MANLAESTRPSGTLDRGNPGINSLARRIIVCISLILTLGSVSAFADPVTEALQATDRLAADRERDNRSRPDITLPLLNLKAGDRVADIFGGSGYYSELIATIVGEDGEVLLVNNDAYAQFAAKGWAARTTDRDIGPITVHTREAAQLDLAPGSLDAALIIMSYHDIYWVDEDNGWPKIDAPGFLNQLSSALKPGARLLIVDHHANAGTGHTAAQDLHRIDIDFAKQDIAKYGLTLVAESDVLRNPDDDYELNVFDPKVRGKTDRFILVFEKT